jgi:hypothetical protein
MAKLCEVLAMSRFAFLAAIGVSLAIAAPALASGDDGFAAFWRLFSAAVAKDDTAALATMVVLGPGLDDNDDPLTFAKFHAADLKAPMRRCLAAGRPVRDVDGTGAVNYMVTCRQVIYVFSKTGAGWKLTDLSPDD